jgi:hypothetical protein
MNETNRPKQSVKSLVQELAKHARTAKSITLTEHEQAQLASAYAYGLKAAAWLAANTPAPSVRRTLRGYVLLGEQAGQVLIISLRGLVVSMSSDFAKGRLGGTWASQEIDDLISDGTLIALEACAEYDSSYGTSVAQWVATRVRSNLHATDFTTGGGVVPREWRKIARAVKTMQASSPASAHTSVSITTETVTDHLMEVETKRLIQKGLSATAAAEKARDVLSRQSLLRGVRELGAAMSAVQGASSLDFTPDDGESSLYDQLGMYHEASASTHELSDADVLMALFAVLPTEDVENATARYGSAGDEVSYRAIADTLGLSWLDVRHGVDRVKAAPSAPHAQFCAFYAHVESMIEVVPSVVSSTGVPLASAALRELLLSNAS